MRFTFPLQATTDYLQVDDHSYLVYHPEEAAWTLMEDVTLVPCNDVRAHRPHQDGIIFRDRHATQLWWLNFKNYKVLPLGRVVGIGETDALATDTLSAIG